MIRNSVTTAFRLLTLTAMSVTLLVGCEQSVVVTTDFPSPLVERLPLDIGVRYPTSFTEYLHMEDIPGQANWNVDIGPANRQLFEKLLQAMFTTVVVLQNGESGSNYPQLDAIVEPTLEAVELSTPKQSGTDQYGVWVKYLVKITSPDGQPIGDWPITGYGQYTARLLDGDTSMRRAAVLALRDAAAKFALEFDTAPGVKAKLLQPNQVNQKDGASTAAIHGEHEN